MAFLANRSKILLFLNGQRLLLLKEMFFNFDYATEIVSAIRTIRKDKQIPNKDSLKLFIKTNEATSKTTDPLVSRLANLSQLSYTSDNVDGAFSLGEVQRIFAIIDV